jgi:hypothetical protein
MKTPSSLPVRRLPVFALSVVFSISCLLPGIAQEDDDGVPKVSPFAAAEAMAAKHGRFRDIHEAFLQSFTVTDPKQIADIMKKTGTIRNEEARWAVRAALVSALAKADSGAAVPVALDYVKELDGVHFFGHEARSMVKGTLEDALRKWASTAPAAASAWFKEASAKGLELRESRDLAETLQVELVAGLIDADRTKGTEQLHTLKPDLAARVLTEHASESVSAEPKAWFLAEVNRLPADSRTWPLSLLTSSVYRQDPAAAAQLIKEHGPNESTRAAMAQAAVTNAARGTREAAPHLAWLKKNAPAAQLSASIGALYGSMGFMEYDAALKGMRQALQGLDTDAAFARFLADSSSSSHGADRFALGCEIKSPQLRREALIAHVKTWGFFSPDEASAAISGSESLSADLKAELLKLIQKR